VRLRPQPGVANCICLPRTRAACCSGLVAMCFNIFSPPDAHFPCLRISAPRRVLRTEGPAPHQGKTLRLVWLAFYHSRAHCSFRSANGGPLDKPRREALGASRPEDATLSTSRRTPHPASDRRAHNMLGLGPKTRGHAPAISTAGPNSTLDGWRPRYPTFQQKCFRRGDFRPWRAPISGIAARRARPSQASHGAHTRRDSEHGGESAQECWVCVAAHRAPTLSP